MTISDDERRLEKVRALLAKAEASTFASEAEAFSAKAQELMARYSIERALLEGIDGSDAPQQLDVAIPNPYAKAKFTLLGAVAAPNRCQALYQPSTRSGVLVGFASDLETVELLYTSLLLQATRLMTAHGSISDPSGTNRTKSFRNSFLFGFAHAIGPRFDANRREAEHEVGDTLLPVLAGRAARVEDKTRELFPNLGTMRSSVSNGAGAAAGLRAGATADIETSRLGGRPRSLGR